MCAAVGDHLLSVYSELLNMAVAQDGSSQDPVGDLVSRALSVRPAGLGRASSADRLADWLAYDVILVHLCERLEVKHRMLDPDAGPVSRNEAERLVAQKLPFFSRALNTA